MSQESSAPSGGDPLDIVPDLTVGDDAAPGDEAGLGDESESKPAAGGHSDAAEAADPDESPDRPNPGGTSPAELAGTSGAGSASDPMPDIAGTSG